MHKISRRELLKIGTASSGLFILNSLPLRLLSLDKDNTVFSTPGQWIRSTCSPNDTGACGMMAYVKDGRIQTLIQAADYPEAAYNPRGCLKGLSTMNLVYGPDRLKYPLIRTGQRGEGKFRKATWEEALDYIAGRLKSIKSKYGPESIMTTIQVGGTGYVAKGAFIRLAALDNWSACHAYDQNGDLPMFWPMTFGVQSEELETLEWLNSRLTVIFGSNPMYTRLPDAHFLTENRLQGGRMVIVDPNYSSTASKADEWIPIAPNTDAAFALGLARVMIEQELYDSNFVKTYSDLPILIRQDNGKRLKAGDLPEDAYSKITAPDYREVYLVFDENRNAPAPLNPENLDLGNVNPALKGEYSITLKGGQAVKCKPAFQMLREMLDGYDLKTVSRVTGAPVETIERLAQEIARQKPLHIIYGASNYQWYHGDLKGRALALLTVLTGNVGKSGAGISTYAGQYKIRFPIGVWWVPDGKKPNWFPFNYLLHGPTKTMSAKYPKNGVKAYIQAWGNPFDQHNLNNRLKEIAAKDELELIVTIDFQMTTSALWSDVVLPGVTWYEKTDLVATPAHPYLQLVQPAIKPLFESKPELWIVQELAHRLNPDYDKYFFKDMEIDQAAEKAINLMLEKGGPLVAGITLSDLKKGPVRLKLPTPDQRQIPFYEQIHSKKPFPPVTYPYPLAGTAQFVKSGRIEFYKDEDVFIKSGEALPVHKPTFEETEYLLNPGSRDKYKFVYLTRNSLYRTHSTHSNNPVMNELQDFKARVWINPEDAKPKGINNNDKVEVYNDRGKVYGFATLDHGIQRGIITFEQGWWSRYLQGTSYNSLLYPWIKPTHEIYFAAGVWSPNTAWNECLCDVRKT
ncbi:MAG: molybdopterin-dependent oxidoreductase [Planctomycetes bacterium]|nr:molybdopterin-dependent oxidoreductase [Planctomycetota bacterium]